VEDFMLTSAQRTENRIVKYVVAETEVSGAGVRGQPEKAIEPLSLIPAPGSRPLPVAVCPDS